MHDLPAFQVIKYINYKPPWYMCFVIRMKQFNERQYFFYNINDGLVETWTLRFIIRITYALWACPNVPNQPIPARFWYVFVRLQGVSMVWWLMRYPVTFPGAFSDDEGCLIYSHIFYYCKISNTRHTKSPNLNVSRLRRLAVGFAQSIKDRC